MGDYAARRSRVADHAARPCGKSRGTPRPYWLKHRGYSRWVITRHAASVHCGGAHGEAMWQITRHAASVHCGGAHGEAVWQITRHAASVLAQTPWLFTVGDHAARRVRTISFAASVRFHSPRPYDFIRRVSTISCGVAFQWCKNREKKGLLGKKF